MNLIDVHCHLNHADFKTDLPEVLERAEQAGIKVILCSGVNPASNKEVLELARKYPIIKASLGIYPIDALGLAEAEIGLPRQTVPINLDEEFKFIEKNKDNVAAIGEVGMDFYWAKKEETYEKQAENFRRIIGFAIKIKKPLVIHSRKAEEECINILEQEIKNKEIPVIQHCFSGRKSLITRAAALGHYFSIPPNILRSGSFEALVKKVDMSQLLTETDAPYLSPYPETRNEPAFVLETIKKIAVIKKITAEETATKIWENYQKIFTT
ncbi:MAG TPA: TatD family hydrolase [Candidatus Nanoarchaeia archaeon]|nr:TatD family hydrolase [Candidatus Nanoarchaeia archaeon]